MIILETWVVHNQPHRLIVKDNGALESQYHDEHPDCFGWFPCDFMTTGDPLTDHLPLFRNRT